MAESGTNGPIILWTDYGCEGWKPASYPSVRAALEAPRYGSAYIITRVVTYKVEEDVLARLRTLFTYIDGINDERDSIPILIEARRILAGCS